MSAAAVVPVEKFEQSSASWVDAANRFEISVAGDADRAAVALQGIKALRAAIAESCDPVVEAAHKAHKAAVAQKKQLEAPLVEAERIFKAKVARFVDEQNRRAREEAALQAAIERERREKAEREAAELAKQGEHELADVVREEAAAVVAPAPVAAPKVAGLATVERWKAEVTDFPKLVAAVAAGQVPFPVLCVDEKVLGQMARSLKGELKWPGVRVFSETGVSTR